MALQYVEDYSFPIGWGNLPDAELRSRNYAKALESGTILLFRNLPFFLPKADIQFLIEQQQAGSRLHKNISYRPQQDQLKGFVGAGQAIARMAGVMRSYSTAVNTFIRGFLVPYRESLVTDYASFRPLEEQGRKLPLHKRNDLLHVDAFPSRPTYGGRILRVFTNLNPAKNRVWLTGQRFPDLARRFAKGPQLMRETEASLSRRVLGQLKKFGWRIPSRSAYDRLMLRLHNMLKENTEIQNGERERIEFPPRSTWLVFTDGVPHAALSGQFALEQTFIVPTGALMAPQLSPIRVLEEIYGRKLA